MKQGITVTQEIEFIGDNVIDLIKEVYFTYSDELEHRDDVYLLAKKYPNDVAYNEGTGMFEIYLDQNDTTKLTDIYYLGAQIVYKNGTVNKADPVMLTLSPTLRTVFVDTEENNNGN